MAAWRARAIKMYPSDFRDAGEDVRTRLLAALCASRQAEITDALVELLVALVHKINARAERRVERQLTAELKKVRGKEGILFRLADAAVGQPEGTVRKVLYPMVGEKTLRDLVAEAKANEKAFKAKVRTTLRSSYGSYYRQMLPPLLRTLGFRCNNGMNVQVITDPFGRLIWASPALPGATHDITAARTHRVIGALAEAGTKCFADKGYQGAGGTVVVPFRGKHRNLSAGKQAVNVAHAKIRAVGEQAMATLKGWRLLRKLRCSTTRITDIVKAVLTLHFASA